MYSFKDRPYHSSLAEVSNRDENCPSGFQRHTLPLYESNKYQGVYLQDVMRPPKNDCTSEEKTITVDIPELEIRRWKLLFAANYPDNARREISSLSDRLRNFPRLDGIRKGKELYIGLAITGFMYGGLHCLAWHAPFATRVETLLWRISSIAVMATFVLVLLLFSWKLRPAFWQDIDVAIDPSNSFWDSLLNFDAWPGWLQCLIVVPFEVIFVLLWDLTVVTVAALYCLARIYLVVECFINLSYLPESVYTVPVWSQYVPHIS
jgi:hypothetical protein